MKVKILLFLLPLFLSASEISLDWLKNKPRTYTKDFFIYQYLQQKITAEESYEALSQTKYVNSPIFKAFAKKFGHDETLAVVQCMDADINDLVEENSDCLSIGFSTYGATKLTQAQSNKAIEKLEEKHPNQAKIIQILKSPIPFTKLISSDSEIFFDTFNECGSNFRENYFNYKLPTSTIKRLENNESFNQTIKLIVTNPKLNNLQKSILNIDVKNIEHKSTFLLAINALKQDRVDLANNYLEMADKKAYFQFDKDKVLFWKYLINNSNEILEKLSNSWDINIYSLYAMELLNKTPKNIIYKIDKKDSNETNFDSTDPFAWIPILNKSRKIDEKALNEYKELFTTDNTLPHLAFVLERFSRYQKSYFITPYEDFLKDTNTTRRSLIYAIARQESHFIPTAISSAFAMGTMQIMPFLSKEIAQKIGENYNIFDQFNPQINLKYANIHLDYLTSKLDNPLFVAYAYNGGIGFLNRTLKKGYFKSKSNYEPFLSMELIPYDETRIYGKKVLANYYIYNNYLDSNNSIKLSTIFEKLK